jgi:hypothetical protein
VGSTPVDKSAEGGDNIVDPSPPTAVITKAAVKATKEAEKERLINWAKGLTLEDVVLTKEGDDSETLGACKWSDLKGYTKMAFITVHKISIAQAFRFTPILGRM